MNICRRTYQYEWLIWFSWEESYIKAYLPLMIKTVRMTLYSRSENNLKRQLQIQDQYPRLITGVFEPFPTCMSKQKLNNYWLAEVTQRHRTWCMLGKPWKKGKPLIFLSGNSEACILAMKTFLGVQCSLQRALAACLQALAMTITLIYLYMI